MKMERGPERAVRNGCTSSYVHITFEVRHRHGTLQHLHAHWTFMLIMLLDRLQ